MVRHLPRLVSDEDDEIFTVEMLLNYEDDGDIIDELDALSPQEQAERMLHWSRLGRFVMSMAQVTPGSEALRDYLNPLNTKVDDLIGIITQHKDLFTDLSVGEKGHIAERFVAATLNDAFRGKSDTFEQWSATGHRGDILGRLHRTGSPPAEVIIEVKDYVDSPSVPSKEVDKFRKDLRMNPHIEAGMFISLHKPVATIPGPVHIEEIDGRPAIYVIQATASEQLFIFAWGMIEVILGRERHSDGPDSRMLEATAERLREAIVAYEQDVSSHVNRIDSIQNHVTTLRSTTDQIQDESLRLRAGVLERLESLKRQLMTEADDLERGDGYSSQTLLDTEEVWLDRWEQLGVNVSASGRTHRHNLLNLLRWCENHVDGSDQIEFEWDDENLTIIRDGDTRINFSWTQTLLRLNIDSEYLAIRPELRGLPGFNEGGARTPAHIEAPAQAQPTLAWESVSALLSSCDEEE